MRFRSVKAAAVVLLASIGLASTQSVASATTPSWEPTAQAVGTITFYDSVGNVITSGSTSTAPFAAYAVGSVEPRAGDTQAVVKFANPDPNSVPNNWYVELAGLFSHNPLTTGPANVKALSQTHPVAAGASNDQTLDGFEQDSTISTTAGYQNVVHIRLGTATTQGLQELNYDDADVSINTATHTWTQIYPTPAVVGQPGTFVSLAPSRVLDTRPGSIAARGTATLSVLGHGGVPVSNVSSVVLNVTVTHPSSSGYITVYGGGTRPTASNLNFVAGKTVPNLVIAPVASDGTVHFYNGSGGTVQLFADVSGYFVGGTASAAGAFASLAPARVLDTRPGSVAARGTATLSVLGHGGVPVSNVSSVVLNVTVTHPSSSGYITVYGGGTRPTASNLNYSAGETVPNLVIAPVASDGTVHFYNGSGGTVQLFADVSGYFVGGTPQVAGAFTSLAPARLLDTRPGSVPARGTATLVVTGHGGVPAGNVSSVVLNVTVTHPSSSGYITVYGGGTRPTASNLNFSAGQTVPNLVVAPVASDGTVHFYNGSSGTVQLLADVSGYFQIS